MPANARTERYCATLVSTSSVALPLQELHKKVLLNYPRSGKKGSEKITTTRSCAFPLTFPPRTLQAIKP